MNKKRMLKTETLVLSSMVELEGLPKRRTKVVDMDRIGREDITVLLSRIKENNLVRELRLTCGNCGVFAVALRDLLQDGKLFNLDDCAHIVLKLENEYIDGTGTHTLGEITRDWAGDDESKFTEDVQYIIENTSKTVSVTHMTEIIVNIIRGDSISSILEFYSRVKRW